MLYNSINIISVHSYNFRLNYYTLRLLNVLHINSYDMIFKFSNWTIYRLINQTDYNILSGMIGYSYRLSSTTGYRYAK